MIPDQQQTQALGSIADGLAGSDPKLASMLNIFSRLAAGEQMPAHEKIPARCGWPGARRRHRTPLHRTRRHRTRWHPRRGTAIPPPRRRHPRLRGPQALVLLWAAISAALIAVALLLNTGSHKACAQPMGPACATSLPENSSPWLAPGAQPARDS